MKKKSAPKQQLCGNLCHSNLPILLALLSMVSIVTLCLVTAKYINAELRNELRENSAKYSQQVTTPTPTKVVPKTAK